MALPDALSSTSVVLSTAVRPDQNTVVSDKIVRPSAKFPLSVWGYFFVDFVQDEEKSDEWSKRARVLKGKVKKILRDARGTPSEIHLVDVIKRVGLQYEFEEEIEDALYRIYSTTSIDTDSHGENHDHLYHEATRFRVLREGGYKASTDVFQKYKDEDGKSFKEELTRNVKGLLSLYEAAFLGIRGEDILDEAIAFTTQHLKLASSSTNTLQDPLLEKHIQRVLEIPTHKRLLWTNSRYFISFYEESQAKTSDPDILSPIIECAKLEYNIVQALYQREIKEVSKWWKESGLVEKLPYARDRVVECYVWVLSSAPEPRFSQSRVFAAKTLPLISLTDDTYDAYGVYEELKLYTDAIERWDLAAMEGLPVYMKPLYNEMVTLFKETEEKLDEEGYPNQIGYVKSRLQELFGGYFQEAEWYHKGYTPGTEEYLHVATKSAGYHALCTLTMVFMNEASIEAFEWSKSKPKIIQSVAEMSRLLNDFVSHEFEQERKHIRSSVECFMEEKGIQKVEEVLGLFKSFYHQTWKDVNEACLRPNPFPMCIIGKPLNLARAIETLYYGNGKDEYTFSGGRTKDMITLLLVNPIPV